MLRAAGDGADRRCAFARPFFRHDADGDRRDRRRARSGDPARSVGEHGLRRSLAKARDAAHCDHRQAEPRAIKRDARCSSRATPRRTCAPPPIAPVSTRRSTPRKVGSGSDALRPALKLAESILSRSPVKRREAVLISDFQKTGWSGSEDVQVPRGHDHQDDRHGAPRTTAEPRRSRR